MRASVYQQILKKRIKKVIMSERNNHKFYIPGIDGMRAIAILAVIAYHISERILPSGFSGVDIFFVISGYVVSSTLARNDTSTFLQFTLNFYKRRILRIFPALILCLLVVSVAYVLFVPSSWLSNTTGGIPRLQQHRTYMVSGQLFFAESRIQSVCAYMVIGC